MTSSIELDHLPTAHAVSPPCPAQSPSCPAKHEPSQVSGQELSRTPSAAESTATSAVGALDASESRVQELEPVDRGRGAMVFLLNSFVLDFVLWGYAGALGSVQLHMSTHAPFPSSSLASIGAVGTITLGLRALWASLGVNVAAMFTSSFATDVAELIFLQGIVCGFSGALLYLPALIYVNLSINPRVRVVGAGSLTALCVWCAAAGVVRPPAGRGGASGVIFCGTGAGGVVFPLALSQLLDRVGLVWATRVWSSFVLITLAPVIYSIHPRLPVVKPAPGARFAPVDFSFLRTSAAITLVLISVTSSLSYFPVMTYLPDYATSVGSALSVDLCLSALEAAWMVSALVVGWRSDKVGWSYLLAALGAVEALVAFSSWTTADTLGKVLGFAVRFGLFAGHSNAWMAAAKDMAGSNANNAAVFCSTMLAIRGVSCVVGPLVAASLYKPEGAGGGLGFGHFGFGGVQVWVGSMAAASAVAGLCMAAIRPSSRRKHQ